MITWLLIIGICLMCWGVSEKYPLSIFAAGTFLFHALDSFVGDSWGASYYVVAASTDLLIMYFISISIRLTALALSATFISAASALIILPGDRTITQAELTEDCLNNRRSSDCRVAWGNPTCADGTSLSIVHSESVNVGSGGVGGMRSFDKSKGTVTDRIK